MFKRTILITLTASSLAMGTNLALAGPGTSVPTANLPAPYDATFLTYYANSPSGTWVSALGNGQVTGTALRKFVDSLPGLGLPGCVGAACNANNLGQYIPIAKPDTTTYPGDDYYEIGINSYTEQMHTDLAKATKLSGYLQLNTVGGVVPAPQHYLGPLILAKTYTPGVASGAYSGPFITGNGRPVRLKVTNMLGLSNTPAGKSFIPVDTTSMGAGLGPDSYTWNSTTLKLVPTGITENYSENRRVIHLHGGVTPWISDGTPHQWFTPLNDPSRYKKGASFQNVPDMVGAGAGKVPGTAADGMATYYYTNQQTGRLMFYHDHAYGTTRLDVYAGEAAPYLIYDQPEQDLIDGTNVSGIFTASGVAPAANIIPNNGGGVYEFGIPLVIQDKTFVPSNIAVQDAKWTNSAWGVPGDLWYPHVYEPNQNPNSLDGANPYGRWDYGPWFWPPVALSTNYSTLPSATAASNVSLTPEAFMDTPVVNGTAYPYLTVNPEPTRFRILNAANDRPWNLQLYMADATGTEIPMVPSVPQPLCLSSATVADASGVLHPTTACTCNPAATPTPFVPAGCIPSSYPDGVNSGGSPAGSPDPAYIGPKMVQIGTEGGFLPAPVILPNQPVTYELNRRNIVVLDVLGKNLLLGPAERADVIIDFSKYAGKTIILYNDAPAPNPAYDTRYDYYTGDPDQTAEGGAPSTLPGFGPNTRTIMQFRVSPTSTANTNSGAVNTTTGALYEQVDAVTGAPLAGSKLAALNATINSYFGSYQYKPVVPEPGYKAAFPTDLSPNLTTAVYSRISDNSITFTPLGGGAAKTVNFKSKAIQELWDIWGRMNATLGVELPKTNNLVQTTIPLGFVDPATEILHNNELQIWKITHNGVDTHPVHFHLYDVQVINRVGWDGAIRPPDANELGWKDTVKMKPLEDVIVAFRAGNPSLPFAIPNSVRPLDPSLPLGAQNDLNAATVAGSFTGDTATFMGIDPLTGNPIVVSNNMTNFGYEYVWHCHILGHEENDFMRAQIMRVPIKFDFDNEGKTAFGVYRPSNGTWIIIDGPNNTQTTLTKWGGSTDIPVPGDYDGDSKTDQAYWRPSNGTWFVKSSLTNAQILPNIQLGVSTDIPVPADYDGDGITDRAVFTPSTGLWKIYQSTTSSLFTSAKWGSSTDKPVPADYDGDGSADLAFWRPSNGTWFILSSSTGAQILPNIKLGLPTDVPVPGDYDGDGQADRAVYRPADGTWHIYKSSTGTVVDLPAITPFNASDIPVPGDYDGDGKTDLAVYRPSQSRLYILQSRTGVLITRTISGGASTDKVLK
jgi:FtsP/CotA-like multicopper oxidase with cupredoxin domain